jgi:Glycosyl transferase family 11
MNDIKKACIRLNGRLGNQLFQLALALRISQDFKVEILLDDYLAKRQGFERFLFKDLCVFDYFQYCSGLKSFANRLQHNSSFRDLYRSDNLFLESECDEAKLVFARIYKSYTGFFQSPSLFPEKDTLLKAFAVRDDCMCESLLNLLQITEQAECLAVSIRRGDFLSHSALGVCSEGYYIDAINFARKKRKIHCIFVFSDDIPYCRELLSYLDCQVSYVEGYTPAKSLYLMSKCQHFVIANSTFSWWGAWLSEYKEKIVIRPDPWNNLDPIAPDFLPTDWIKIPKVSTKQELISSQHR